MSEEKRPRFLQQTRSQLLHQQEALRKRREMLERESTKPPAMRFGTSTPPRSLGRRVRSPVPLSSASDRHAPCPAVGPGSSVHRELKWSRCEEEKTAERAPMRFSMAFRPSPTPAVLASTRSAIVLHASSPPSPREVNTSHHLDSIMVKLQRETSTPRTVSSQSPVSQRSRVERDRTPNNHNTRGAPGTPHVLTPNPWSLAQLTANEVGEVEPSVASTGSPTPARAAVVLRPTPPKCESREAVMEEQAPTVSGNAGRSNTFAVPRFTPISPVVPSAMKRPHQPSEEKQGTPEHRSAGEFRTPLPLARISSAVTPSIHCSASPQGESAHRHGRSVMATEGGETGSRASPTPTVVPLGPLLTSIADDLQGCPHYSGSPADEEQSAIVHDTVSTKARASQATVEKAASLQNPSFTTTTGSASPRPGTPPLTPRHNASPVPTTHDLIHSVQVSAEKRPCGGERSTLSSKNSVRRGTTATPSRTGSPPPTPVPPSDIPMTDFGALTHKCCDRPTPVSISSLPAGGEVRGTTPGTPSASPWPTTENIISSIIAGAKEEQRRGRGDFATGTTGEDERETLERFSNEEVNVSHTNSPNVSALETLAMKNDNEEGDQAGSVSGEPFHAKWNDHVAAHTPSPVPSHRQYGQSFLASTEKRRCGRPTPSVRHVSLAADEEHSGGAAQPISVSPQPSPRHLFHSLDVSIESGAQQRKPTEGAMEAEKSGTGGETTGEIATHQAALRTPSPTPTPENVISSLQASAEKRRRSGAVDANSGSKGLSAAAATRSSGSSHQSPTLTPQNVKESVQHLIRDRQQGFRSDAPAPIRPWTEPTRVTVESPTYGTTWNSPTSPAVTAEDVDKTLETLERDERCQSRSSHAPRVSDVSPEQPNVTVPRDSGESFVNVEERATVGDISAVPASSFELNGLPSVVSPALSDLAAASAMFFDCASAPPTPALQKIETATKTLDSSVCVLEGRDCGHIPPQFFDLQREIVAISEGRGRSRTPPPLFLRGNEPQSPLSSVVGMLLAEEDTPRAEASMEKADPTESIPPRGLHTVMSTCGSAAENNEDAQVGARRSSLILVHPTTASRALLQHPHEAPPDPPVPSMSEVQVPRTPTPPPQYAVEQAFVASSEGHPVGRTRSAHLESPLPRPVSLRSQVSLGKPLQVSRSHPSSGSPAPAWRTQASLTLKRGGISTPSPRTGLPPPERTTASVQHDEERNQQADVFGPQNDWMDLVESLRPQTITVSPQAGTVMYTAHHSTDRFRDPENLADCASPSLCRKRSRSGQTPTAPSRQMAAATPASIALTMDEGGSSDNQSVRGAATPNSHVSQTPRSSTRGRKSQAEELLDMLPAEVVAEVARMQEADELAGAPTAPSALSAEMNDARPSSGSLDGRFSGVSEGDSIVGQLSTISQRVSQRPRRVYHNYDYYIQYLEGIATSSAKKARKAAARRVHRTVTVDVAKGKTKPAKQHSSGHESPLLANGTPAESPAVCGSRSQSTSSSREGGTASRVRASAMDLSEDVVSPPTPSPMRGGEGRELKVSTRLSAELEKALFEQPSHAKRERQGDSQKSPPGAPAKFTKAAKKSPTPSLKSGGSATPARKPKTPRASLSSTCAKKTVKKFLTAKSMRVQRRSAKHRKA
ncbi:hypothetical protein JKF63_02474 [Porcisia hertigi]|uniref:Uncharacterized protein n=1 Tax=Porcisia hertigi TaxID=2761500 RepID=A0A836I9K5_9TRYP|nr:hypothetical protein JKF63_02474 [Porcisia hertigi]